MTVPQPSLDALTVAIDPGKRYLGMAVFLGHHLSEVHYFEGDDFLDPAQQAAVTLATEKIDYLIIEGQQIYRGPSKTDPNDLIPLANQVGALFGVIPAKYRIHPLPREWKGTTPKQVFTNRILSKLEPIELEQLEKISTKERQGHCIDAIGLGLWTLGRL